MQKFTAEKGPANTSRYAGAGNAWACPYVQKMIPTRTNFSHPPRPVRDILCLCCEDEDPRRGMWTCGSVCDANLRAAVICRR